MQGFKSTPHAQRALSTHAAIGDAFVFQRHMIKRPTLRLFRRADVFCLGRGGYLSAAMRPALEPVLGTCPANTRRTLYTKGL